MEYCIGQKWPIAVRVSSLQNQRGPFPEMASLKASIKSPGEAGFPGSEVTEVVLQEEGSMQEVGEGILINAA